MQKKSISGRIVPGRAFYFGNPINFPDKLRFHCTFFINKKVNSPPLNLFGFWFYKYFAWFTLSQKTITFNLNRQNLKPMKNLLFLIIGFCIPTALFSQKTMPKSPYEVVNLIKKNVTCSWADQTVDNFKSGNPDVKLNGIAVCMFADMATLRKAVEKNCNFIITHEPLFYNHTDETSAFASDPVYLEKKKFIEKHNLVIFRFHDHIHRTNPDGISVGMIEKMGLNPYVVNNSLTFFDVPEQTVAAFAAGLKNKLGLETIRVIGNPEMKFSKLAFMAGAPGGQRHIQMLARPDVEVVIGGEAPEWETYLYVNDAAQSGNKKAVIFLGHIKSEEAGMEYCAKWLSTFIDGVPIEFIENNSNFSEL